MIYRVVTACMNHKNDLYFAWVTHKTNKSRFHSVTLLQSCLVSASLTCVTPLAAAAAHGAVVRGRARLPAGREAGGGGRRGRGRQLHPGEGGGQQRPCGGGAAGVAGLRGARGGVQPGGQQRVERRGEGADTRGR